MTLAMSIKTKARFLPCMSQGCERAARYVLHEETFCGYHAPNYAVTITAAQRAIWTAHQVRK